MRRRVFSDVIVCLCAAGTAVAGSARAQPASPTCGGTDRPWVAVHAPADLPRTIRGFVDLLRAELASRGIDLCADTSGATTGKPAIATIDVSSSPDEVTLGVEVRDALTAKHVSRDVSLGGVPSDSRPLTIALEADELLRASWAELALHSAPPPAQPVPSEVTRTMQESVAAPPPAASPPRMVLGVDGAFEHYTSGTSLYGADARFAARLLPRVAATLRAGLRSGSVLAAADGEVRPEAWLAGAGAEVELTSPVELRWGIDAVAHLDLEHVTFTPTPRATAVGDSGSDFAFVAGLGAQAWLRIFATLRIGAQVVALLPLRPVEATDAHVEVAGVSGAGIGALLGAWSTL